VAVAKLQPWPDDTLRPSRYGSRILRTVLVLRDARAALMCCRVRGPCDQI